MRDYYCASTSKAGYFWQPIDLICQSGYLAAAHDVTLLDAPAQGWGRDRALAWIREQRPAAVLSLVGTAAIDEDLEFLAAVHAATGCRLFVSGDFARFAPQRVLDGRPEIEGVLLDFTRPDLRDRLAGAGGAAPGLFVRGDPPAPLPRAGASFSYPLPRHDLFLRLPYRMPFLGRPFASTLASYGCAFGCRYCNSSEIGFALRDPENLFAEIDALRALHVTDLFFKDFTFNQPAERAKLVLQQWLARGDRFRWIAYFRAENIDDELAALLARAGCAMAQVGLETANETVLRAVRPTADLPRALAGLAALRRAGVPYGAHFIVGLPGDDDAGFAATVRLARTLRMSYASFNVFTPRIGAELGANRGDIAGWRMDPSRAAHDGALVSARQARTAARRFYLHPDTALTLLRSIRSPRVFLSLMRMGAAWARQAWSEPR
jgi:hypothetical protein